MGEQVTYYINDDQQHRLLTISCKFVDKTYRLVCTIRARDSVQNNHVRTTILTKRQEEEEPTGKTAVR